jgi:formamidopyrimidine-DNA glycosylase
VPEGLEAEIWKRSIETLVGRTVTDVWLDERVADPGVAALVGHTIDAVLRLGKVVQLCVGGDMLGLHFGMTGRVIVDGAAPIESLEYSSSRDRPEWDTLRLFTANPSGDAVPALRVNDPRRLGRISLDADLTALGVDIFQVSTSMLTDALADRSAAIKSLLLNQSVIAGLGNLCADEVLWWSGLAPSRSADELTPAERGALASAIRRRLPIMLRRGGSTNGELDPALRRAQGPCPRDGAPLERATIGGRTAVWCPKHQR